MAVVSGRSEGGGKIFAKFGNVLLQMGKMVNLKVNVEIFYRAAKLCKKKVGKKFQVGWGRYFGQMEAKRRGGDK